MGYQAIMVGATGAVGGALFRELVASPRCESVIALVRRPVDLGAAAKVRVEVVNLAGLEEATARWAAAAGCDRAFCTMGVGHPSNVAFEEFWRVDVEYAGAFARGAAAGGVRHVSLLSALGANLKSWVRYFRVKGAAEEAVTKAGLSRTSLFRPSLLVTKEIRYGLLDRFAQTVFPVIARLLPATSHQIRVEDLGRAFCLNAERPARASVEILHYPEFAALLTDRPEGMP